ncbi:MAG: YifB family Mg chelatase-like AAA ATPase [Cellvibrionales bacterium]|nr:YifB family Mg chelatase-like AAA ATPase [Cellvibrionales bacterium]
MKLSSVSSYAITGIEARPIQIEVHIANGLPSLSIVGLPEASVKESKDRVRSAILNSGFEYPARRITVNLAPADLPKQGAGFDLPIAIGILHASGQMNCERLESFALAGELSLSGQIRPISGALPMAIQSQREHRQLILPAENCAELAVLPQQNCCAARLLTETCAHLSGDNPLPSPQPTDPPPAAQAPCISQVRGQPQARRALELAAAGGHSLLFEGPPGVGKTMLAARIPGILPPLTTEQAIDVARIYSVAKLERPDFYSAPFRAPHHTSSSVALVGGGSHPAPGEISLAHCGVLFLDELPEFPVKVLEVLRQPIESGEILISRAAFKSRFPCRFQLIAAMNPCPCGYAGESRCGCSPDRILRYRNRISGPVLDRIDMYLKIRRAKPDMLLGTPQQADEEGSTQIRQRVVACRNRQLERQGVLNSALDAAQLSKLLAEEGELTALAERALRNFKLSVRALHRTLRTAHTIADLAEQPLTANHFKEALGYRFPDPDDNALSI